MKYRNKTLNLLSFNPIPKCRRRSLTLKYSKLVAVYFFCIVLYRFSLEINITQGMLLITFQIMGLVPLYSA